MARREVFGAAEGLDRARIAVGYCATLEELDGYEAEARRAGLVPGELALIVERRLQLAGRR